MVNKWVQEREKYFDELEQFLGPKMAEIKRTIDKALGNLLKYSKRKKKTKDLKERMMVECDKISACGDIIDALVSGEVPLFKPLAESRIREIATHFKEYAESFRSRFLQED